MPKRLWIGALIGLYLLTAGFTVVGHRGDPIDAPEETFQSDDAAFARGSDYVELDVHESQDGVLVIQHDDNIQRMTGHNALIAQTPYAVLHGYHTKNGEPVHSLQELFAHYQSGQQKFLIETKIVKGEPHPDLEKKIAALVTQYGMQNRVMFHSFSLSSLKRLQKLLPNCPRLFIVGSLKRINYSVFQWINGIDVSTDLLTKPLVSSLHAIGQKVFAWDEMTETPAKWQWLVNLNIDGVVTNYPAIAHQYATLKAEATTVNRSGLASNSSLTSLPIYQNPYTPTPTQRTIAPVATFDVLKEVKSGGQTFYQLSQNQFVAALTVNFAPTAGWANQLLGQTAWIHHQGLGAALHPLPQTSSGQCALLANNTPVTIDAVHLTGGTPWLHVAQGWLKASALQLRLTPTLDAPAMPHLQVALRLTPNSSLLTPTRLGA
ncbi:MAG: glycerophosphodiester phosphodiesterase [Lactobacillus sp.]|jgi:glycerophosphoryl diester phosphodiesterase|nr:glycerophosphodiester phosphodiesterase [Lactobacillus sp.]MCI1918106.1 glycerophosphodiester phosphodiesterase [Lactobacillus sp.]MCI1941401.1 glycerophosphodiester phosphodiesterase [Lactobacillus sp.]MCI1971946.1 glycerophosphodiester phosphodiesterase [Lactobacillus sp.]MCI2017803.1 glycerophosphodiester phosphodiesterase [Lactobacillus sp.]